MDDPEIVLEADTEKIVKTLDNDIPGTSSISKLWYCLACTVFVAARLGMTEKNFLKLCAQLFNKMSKFIPADQETTGPINKIMESSVVETVEVPRGSTFSPSFHRLTEKDFN